VADPPDTRPPYWFFDSRSLSLFRVLLGFTSLWSILDYLSNITWFLGRHATVTAESVWLGYTVKPWLFSTLFLFPQSDLVAWLVALLGCLGAVALAIGWFPRVGALLCWFAFGTIMARNPLVLHSGDSFMMLMLLYAAILPAGRHLRFGASKRSPLIFCNFATTLWLIQIAILYLSAGLAKLPVESWRNGQHLALLLGGTEIPTPFGSWLGQFGFMNQWATIGSLILELALPVLVLALPACWQRLRLALVVVLLLFHAIIGLTLQVGLFGMLSITAAATLIPSLFWDGLKRLSNRDTPRTLPELAATRHPHRQMTGAGLLGLLFAWQALAALYPRAMPFPHPLNAALYQLQINQRWTVFAGTPTEQTRWGIELVSEDGARIDLRLGVALLPHRFHDLPSETERFGGSRWRFLILDQFIRRPATRQFIPRFLQIEARRMLDHPEQLQGQTLEFVLYRHPLDESNRFYRSVLGRTTLP